LVAEFFDSEESFDFDSRVILLGIGQLSRIKITSSSFAPYHQPSLFHWQLPFDPSRMAGLWILLPLLGVPFILLIGTASNPLQPQ
jgi:hypothetical protein